MIFAAGIGTRLRPLTSDKPKALVEVNNKTLLENAIIKLKNCGVTHIVINVHHFANKIIDFLNLHNNFGIDINISDETHKLLNTGGGVLHALPFFNINNPIILYNVDIYSSINLAELYKKHVNNKFDATLVVRNRTTNRKLAFNKNNDLIGWKNFISNQEKHVGTQNLKEANFYGFSGIHIVHPKIFKNCIFSEDFSIIDFYLNIAKHYQVKGYLDESEFWFDLGKIEQIKEIEKRIK